MTCERIGKAIICYRGSKSPKAPKPRQERAPRPVTAEARAKAQRRARAQAAREQQLEMFPAAVPGQLYLESPDLNGINAKGEA